MLSKIDICSMALLKIGEKPIQSFNEDTAAAQLARTLYDSTIDSLISSHPWSFAQKKYEMIRTTDEDFLVPNEVLRVLSCSGTKYEISGNRIITNAPNICLNTLVRVGAECFPAYFTSIAATKLAMEFCIPLSDNQNAYRTLAALYESELRAAKFIDSTMSVSGNISDFSLLSARF